VFFIEAGLSEIVSEFEKACLIVSAIAHDLGHPGLNNGFMVATKSK
jgi:3',5'-cyclic-nucleotide phosphodiesterase/cAMP-specific phosphodiesterase 4